MALVRPVKHKNINVTRNAAAQATEEFIYFMLHFMVTSFKMCFVRAVRPRSSDLTSSVLFKNF